ncbi:MAG TPA: hypothetical protein VMW41_05470 [Candidatus Bathyarchaeia archaeon]|nr:hypothetical protein [Candidatus Bathyarchaeia archaeon]
MFDLKKDYKDYLALVTLLAFGLLAFVYFGYNRRLQTIIVLLIAGFYVLWGSLHHLANKDFHLKVLAEYLAIAAFAAVLLVTLLWRT